MILKSKSGSKCSFTPCKLRFFTGFFLASSALALVFNGLFSLKSQTKSISVVALPAGTIG